MITIESSNRVLRGGSWNNSAANCRVANRNNNDPSNRNSNNGFRVVLSQLKRKGGYPLLNRLSFLSPAMGQINLSNLQVSRPLSKSCRYILNSNH